MRHSKNIYILKLPGSSLLDVTAKCHPQSPGCQCCLQEEPQTHTKAGRQNCRQKILIQNPWSERKELLSLFISPTWPARFVFLSSWHNLNTAEVVATGSSWVRCELMHSFIARPHPLNPGGCSSPLAGATLGFSLAINTRTHVRGRWDGGNEISHVSKHRC